MRIVFDVPLVDTCASYYRPLSRLYRSVVASSCLHTLTAKRHWLPSHLYCTLDQNR